MYLEPAEHLKAVTLRGFGCESGRLADVWLMCVLRDGWGPAEEFNYNTLAIKHWKVRAHVTAVNSGQDENQHLFSLGRSIRGKLVSWCLQSSQNSLRAADTRE